MNGQTQLISTFMNRSRPTDVFCQPFAHSILLCFQSHAHRVMIPNKTSELFIASWICDCKPWNFAQLFLLARILLDVVEAFNAPANSGELKLATKDSNLRFPCEGTGISPTQNTKKKFGLRDVTSEGPV